MEIPSYLSKTGLPPSVLHVCHVLSGANQLEALRLAHLYSTNINTISRAEVEKTWREQQAKLALSRRVQVVNKAQVARAKHVAATRAAVLELLR